MANNITQVTRPTLAEGAANEQQTSVIRAVLGDSGGHITDAQSVRPVLAEGAANLQFPQVVRCILADVTYHPGSSVDYVCVVT